MSLFAVYMQLVCCTTRDMLCIGNMSLMASVRQVTSIIQIWMKVTVVIIIQNWSNISLRLEEDMLTSLWRVHWVVECYQMMLKPSYTKFCRSWLPHSKVISHIPMCIPILEKSPSASFQCYHNHMEVQCTKQMEWLVLVSRVPVGRILMAILLCNLESLLYTVSMVCVMDLKSYRSESPQH